MVNLLSINIITELPIWLSLFCVALGIGYAFFLYRNDEKFSDTPQWLVKVMAISRFLLVTILAFFLLSPFIKTLFNKIEKPVIIMAQDNSSSLLLNNDSIIYKGKYLEDLSSLKKKLEEIYEVRSYTFGEKLIEGSQIGYTEKITDISNVFEELENKYYNKNVGALILASDGIFNQGENPVFSAEIDFPVYAIAMGDTALKRDVLLKDIVYNKLTFLGNKFPVEIDVQSNQSAGNSTELEITHNGEQLFSKKYNIDSDDFISNESVLLEANEVGVQHYRISLTRIEGEVSITNNVKDIYIEVLDGRKNVLILSHAPHPDVKALKTSIESNENYEVTSQLINEFDGNIEGYSMAVVHQIPKVITPSFKKLLESKLPALYVLGNQSAMQVFNTLNENLNINSSGGRFNEVLPMVLSNFPLFTLSEKTMKSIEQMPPVIAPFGNYQMKTSGYTLLSQKIGSVETEAPLMSFYQNESHKMAVFSAEGIWKWRMKDYFKNNNHESFDELINKTVQFLSVKEDKGKFRVFTENNYTENQEIKFDAELYNESYELINDPEVTIDLLDDKGRKYSFVFNKTANRYILNAGILPPGFYSFTAKAKHGNKSFVSNGKFQIKQLYLEANNTRADHQLLQNIVQKFGGGLFYPNQFKELSRELFDNGNIASIIYEEEDLKELIKMKWIFFLLFSLLSLEWFLRKRNGAY